MDKERKEIENKLNKKVTIGAVIMGVTLLAILIMSQMSLKSAAPLVINLILFFVGFILFISANLTLQSMLKEDADKERQRIFRNMMSNDPIGTRDMIMNSAGLSTPTSPIKEPPKKASVVGRAVVGGIIGGETGAVIGAMSAMNENNNKK